MVDPRDGRYRLLWGVVGASATANCHVIVQHQLTQEFNEHENLVRLVTVSSIHCMFRVVEWS